MLAIFLNIFMLLYIFIYGSMAEWLLRLYLKQVFVGSNPTGITIELEFDYCHQAHFLYLIHGHCFLVCIYDVNQMPKH